MLAFSVQADLCTRCGLCVLDCPSRIIETNGDRLPFISAQSEGNCLQCQHCLAVWPTGAISILGLNPADSRPVSADDWPGLDEMTHLVRSRRSVRQYCDRNVERELIDRLLATLAYAPTGINSRLISLTIIDDKEQMDRLRQRVMRALIDALKAGRIPQRAAYLQRVIWVNWPWPPPRPPLAPRRRSLRSNSTAPRAKRNGRAAPCERELAARSRQALRKESTRWLA